MGEGAECWACGNYVDAFTAVGVNKPPAVEPYEGATSLCAHCGCFAIFTGNGMESREPTAEEALGLMVDPVFRAVQLGIRSRPAPLRRRGDI